MKLALSAVLILMTVATLRAQRHYDVTVYDGNRLRPGATQKEMIEWVMSRAVEAAFAAAIQQPNAQSASQFSPEQIQLIKMSAVRGKVLDQLVNKHPELKAEADALYVEYDMQAGQAIAQSNSARSAQQVQLIKLLAIRATICDRIVNKHPDLKPESDALYVQYDSQITQEMLKAAPK